MNSTAKTKEEIIQEIQDELKDIIEENEDATEEYMEQLYTSIPEFKEQFEEMAKSYRPTLFLKKTGQTGLFFSAEGPRGESLKDGYIDLSKINNSALKQILALLKKGEF